MITIPFLTASKISKELDLIISSEINVKILEQKIIKVICEYLGASSTSFLLVSDFISRPLISLGEEKSKRVRFAPLEKMLHHVGETLVYNKLSDPLDKQIFSRLNIKLILSLKVLDEDIGLLILGPKKSGWGYSRGNVRLLERIKPQISLAIKNADNYRKIQEFSQTLEAKVIDRTHELEIAHERELKLKDEFVFIATHDLATPVTAISGFSALINKRQENISKELQGYLNAITEASDRLKVLVNDLLSVARSDSGTIKVELTKVDAKQIIESSVREIIPLANKKQIKVLLNLGPDNMLQADPVKLAEICENLLSNGVKYNHIDGSLTITTSVSDNKFNLEFKDTGIGVPVSEQSKVFTKFFRSESAEVRQNQGTGLGLFVVRMLTEKMGGTISFESKEGQGTTFNLSFNR